jgi:hypothetical protein
MSYLPEAVESGLNDSIARTNGVLLNLGDLEYSNIRTQTSGPHNTKIHAKSKTPRFEGETDFRYDRVKLVANGVYPNTLPARPAKYVSDLLPLVNQICKFDLRKSDIVDREINLRGVAGETFTLTCSEDSPFYTGGLTFTLQRTAPYLLTGVFSIVKGTRYRITTGPEASPYPDVEFASLVIGGVEHQLTQTGHFTSELETGDYPFSFSGPTIANFPVGTPMVRLDKAVNYEGDLSLSGFLRNNSKIVSIGDNVFEGNAGNINLQNFANGASNLTSVGINFAKFDGGFTNLEGAFTNCRKLEHFGETLASGKQHTANTINEIFKGCRLLANIPYRLFDGAKLVSSASYAFSEVGADTPDGAAIDQRTLRDLVSVTNASYIFYGAKLVKWPADMLVHLVSVNNLQSGFANTNLETIPSGFLSSMINLNNASSCFQQLKGPIDVEGNVFAVGISLNAGNMFASSNLRSLSVNVFRGTSLNNATGMFIKSTLPAKLPNFLANQKAFTSLNSFFKEATVNFSAANSDLFADQGAVTDVTEIFRDAKFQNGILPVGLFDPLVNATATQRMFTSSRGVDDVLVIPAGVFGKMAKATDFSSCFASTNIIRMEGSFLPESKSAKSVYQCFNGSMMTSYPANLMSHGDNITNADYCFASSYVETLPPTLLAPLTSVTSFKNGFAASNRLKSIPYGFFDGLSSVVSMRDGFSTAKNKLVLPPDAFKKLVALEDVQYLFRNAVGVEIHEGLFARCLKLNNASSVFDSTTIYGDVSDMFSDAHRATPPNLSNAFNRADLTNSNFGKTKINLPIGGNVLAMFGNAKLLRDLLVPDFLTQVGTGADNHLTLENNNLFLLNCTWLKGARHDAIKGLWHVADPNTIPANVTNGALSGTTGLV